MSSHPNSSDPTKQLIRTLVTIVIVIFLAREFFRSGSHRTVTHSPGPGVTHNTGPARNPIEDMLRTAPNGARQSGVAVALLVDTSGSMGEPVRDADGKPRPKIQIARRCVLQLIGQMDTFAKAHPDRPICLGVYEFSARPNSPSARRVVPLGPVNLAQAQAAVRQMHPQGGTPIGDAMIMAKRDLDATGLTKLHLLVVTDGENNQGYDPGDVAAVLARQSEDTRAAVYFIAFDVAAETFRAVRDAGGLVLPAANERELQQTLNYVLTGKILAEQPEVPTKSK